jgi:16S rRNA (uracil1498-N3)-methyltransferase
MNRGRARWTGVLGHNAPMPRSRPATRLFCPGEIPVHGVFELRGEQAHHVLHVLRLGAGDVVTIFDGRGTEYPASLERVSRSGVSVRLGEARRVTRESPLAVSLAQGISSGERMDYTIQKAVELGVCEIQPIACERSVVRLAPERAVKRVAHWQAIAAAACEQSGRNVVPRILAVEPLARWLSTVPADALRVTLSPDAETTLRALPNVPSRILLLVGPEGGLSPAERLDAQNVAFAAVRLGPRVLRTETAALAALAAMQTLWGDF